MTIGSNCTGQERGEPSRDDASRTVVRVRKSFFAVATLTTGAVLTVAWIGLLSWLLAHAVQVTFW